MVAFPVPGRAPDMADNGSAPPASPGVTNIAASGLYTIHLLVV
jgi:hypothetical protein